MRLTTRLLLASLFLQAAMFASGNGSASAQALYTNPDTIQQYLKDRIGEVKEQLKETRS